MPDLKNSNNNIDINSLKPEEQYEYINRFVKHNKFSPKI